MTSHSLNVTIKIHQDVLNNEYIVVVKFDGQS